jgi:hypothetical protein
MTYEVTIDDPVAYTKPWKNTRRYWRMKPGEELIENPAKKITRTIRKVTSSNGYPRDGSSYRVAQRGNLLLSHL